MSIASRHRKLHLSIDNDQNRHNRIEDLLTADVFGAYRYLPPDLGILPLLASAESANETTLTSWSRERGIELASLSKVEIVFWPSIGGREPDLLVSMASPDGGASILVLIEAKLHAQQHEIDGVSQLGYYGSLIFDDDLLGDAVDMLDLPEYRPIILLTSESKPPVRDLLRAQNELFDYLINNRTEVFWTSWHRAREVGSSSLDAAKCGSNPLHVVSLLIDLLDDLSDRGFRAPRERLPWPLPSLRPLLPATTERWLHSSFTQPSACPSMMFLAGIQLDRAEDFLRKWRFR